MSIEEKFGLLPSPEAPDDKEWKTLLNNFPNIGPRDGVKVLAKPTDKFNCLGWCLNEVKNYKKEGDDDKFWDVEFLGERFQILFGWAQLEEKYKDHAQCVGYHRGGVLNITHVTKLYKGEWTSKLGDGLLISHPRDGLKNPAENGYGWPEFYWGPSPSTQSSIYNSLDLAGVLLGGDKFERCYGAWKATWNLTEVQLSSRADAYTKSDAYKRLVGLGPSILPRLADKLKEPGNDFAVIAYRELENHATIDHVFLADERALILRNSTRPNAWPVMEDGSSDDEVDEKSGQWDSEKGVVVPRISMAPKQGKRSWLKRLLLLPLCGSNY